MHNNKQNTHKKKHNSHLNALVLNLEVKTIHFRFTLF